MKKSQHLFEIALAAAGLWLLFHIVSLSDLGILKRAIFGVGWVGYLFCLFIYPAAFWLDTEGWKCAFDPPTRAQLSSKNLYLFRVAGEGLNNITPVLDVGGEPIKILLLSQKCQIAKKASLAAGVVSRTALLYAQTLFIAVGVWLSFFLIPTTWFWRLLLAGSALLAWSVVFVFIEAEKRGGLFSGWMRFLSDRLYVPLHKVDEDIRWFHKTQKPMWNRALALHLGSWLLNGLETAVLLRLAGLQVTWVEGVMVEALVQLLRMGGFFVPASLGVQETGYALFTQAMGFDPAFGLAAALLKRARQVLWIGAGFALWGFFRVRPESQETAGVL